MKALKTLSTASIIFAAFLLLSSPAPVNSSSEPMTRSEMASTIGGEQNICDVILDMCLDENSIFWAPCYLDWAACQMGG